MKDESIKSEKICSIANLKIVDGGLKPNRVGFLHAAEHDRMPIRVVGT